ncbi:MAG: hypothetical protein IJQ42_10915, partial [Oscillospiraceae bacterium]|nr:hypothetical protein [Oscillospiraceae bacterium]
SQSEFLICLSFATLISGFPLFPELILARILQSGTYSCKLELRFAIELFVSMPYYTQTDCAVNGS